MNTMTPEQDLDWLYYELMFLAAGFTDSEVVQWKNFLAKNRDLWQCFDRTAYDCMTLRVKVPLRQIVQSVNERLRIELKRGAARRLAMMVNAKYEVRYFDIDAEFAHERVAA